MTMQTESQLTPNEIIGHNQPRIRVQITFPKKGRTKQSFKDECDINQILAKYQKTNAMEHVNQYQGQYAFATGINFTEAMQLITTAQDMFDGLPSSIRTRFANDPAQFLDFVQSNDNDEEMQKLGLIPKNKPPENTSDEQKTDTPTPTIPKETKPE